MNRKTKLVSLALAALLLAAPLTACTDAKDPAETGSDTGSVGTGSGADKTPGGTTADGEDVTLPPRYDYMKESVMDDVDLDKSDYTNLTLTVPNSLKIEADDVLAYIEKIRFQNRTAVNGTAMMKDQPLALGDDAFIYYKGFLNGEAFEGGSNWDDQAPYQLGLGSGSFIPGFEEALVGVVPNTTSKQNPTEITVTFPEDYNDELGGKEVIFRISVEYAVQYTLPTYDRDFVEKTLKYQPKKEFYASDRALLDEFEEYVFDHLTSQNQSSLQNARSSALWEHLNETAVCRNLPQSEVDYYYNVYYSEAKNYYDTYKNYYGESFTTMYPDADSFMGAYFGFPAGSDWKVLLTDMAKRLVCRDMITHAIAEREGLETVTDEQYEEQIQYWVDYYSSYYGTMTREDIIKNLGEAFLRESALSDAMGDWLMEQVTFTYEDGTPIVSTTENGD